MSSYRQSTGGSGGYNITVTSPDEEAQQGEMVEPQANLEEQEAGGQAQHGIELLSSTVEPVTSTVPTIDELPSADDTLLARGEYEKVTALPLAELQTFFREQIKRRWSYVHTNAMGIAFVLDPAMDLNDSVGTDDDSVDDQVCNMARRCGILTPTAGIPKLTAEILAIKSDKRRGGEAQRNKYSESSPRDY